MPSTKTEVVYRILKDGILMGEFQPGRRLRLTEIADRFGISEMPIREALRMLQRDGLVLIESHRGATVIELSLQELFDIVATRTYLEILAVCEASPFHTDETFAELDRLLDEMDDAADGSQFGKLNHLFHRTLYAPCRNEFLKREIDELWARAWQRWTKSLFDLRPDRQSKANKEHRLIVSAVKSGSVREIEKVLKAHREETLASWTNVIQTLAPSTEKLSP
jgi:DNA-binding GntR family transcriptional regulator